MVEGGESCIWTYDKRLTYESARLCEVLTESLLSERKDIIQNRAIYKRSRKVDYLKSKGNK